jgi:hypothetical protein
MFRDSKNQNIDSIDVANLMSIQSKAKTMPAYKVPRNASADLRTAMTAFFKGEVLKSGNYVATANALVYRSISVVDNFKQDVLCLRLIQDGKAYYLGNSSTLQVSGTRVAFGNRTRNWGASEPQKVMESMGVPMLPFNAFTQAGLKVTQTKIIDQTGPETVKRMTKEDKKGNKTYENVHFTGASLFQNGDAYFLFDIDRVEIGHGIFNPFIVELPRAVKTIDEAYDSLIPLAVRTAKAEGKTVLRQGEHFFILIAEANAYKADREARSEQWNEGYTEGRMSAQGNRDHVASRFNKKSGLVSGYVRHQGREHLDLDLTIGWWRPIPNTAVKAFTITGDID